MPRSRMSLWRFALYFLAVAGLSTYWLATALPAP